MHSLCPIIFIIFSFLNYHADTLSTHRLVVTFQSAADNLPFYDGDGDLATSMTVMMENDDTTHANLSMVKQYGRRLVLNLGRTFDLYTEQTFFKSIFLNVQSVDPDYIVALQDANGTHATANWGYVGDPLLLKLNNAEETVYSAQQTINPDAQTPLWNLMDSEPFSIHAEGVWSVTNSTPEVVVAVIDSGIAEIARRIFLHLLDGYDFISNSEISLDGDGRDGDSTDPGDECSQSWHGTRVSSILASRHDNEWGMKGVAENCSVLPIRVLGLCQSGYATDVTDAIVWAAGGTINGVTSNPNPAKIISLSLAGKGACPGYLQSAINQASALGSILIAAAGNNNLDASHFFPANCENVIAVASSTRDGKLAPYSNWGSLISFSAPGGDSTDAIMALSVNSTGTNNNLQVAYGIGTSFAVPHVSGIAAVYTAIMIAKRKASLSSYYSDGTGTDLLAAGLKLNFSDDYQMQGLTFYFRGFNTNLNDSQSCSNTQQEACGGNGIISMAKTEFAVDKKQSPYHVNSSWNESSLWNYNLTNNNTNYLSVFGAAASCDAGAYTTSYTSPTCTACSSGTFRSIPMEMPWAPMGWLSSTTMNGYPGNCVYHRMTDGQPGYICLGGAYYVWWWVYVWLGGWCGCYFGGTTYNDILWGPGGYWENMEYPPMSVLLPTLSDPQFCLGCPEGTYSTASRASVCTQCGTGTYNTGTGFSTCTQCGAGTYSTGTGLSACTPCPAGTYSAGIGQTLSSTCQTCSIGTYSNSGAAYCSKCTQAKYAAAPGTVECTLMSCFAGSYSSGLGLTAPSCTTCGAGTYRPIPVAMPWAPTGWTSSTDTFRRWYDGWVQDYTNCVYNQMSMNQPAYQCSNGVVWWWGYNMEWFAAYDVSQIGGYQYMFHGAAASCPNYCLSGEYAPMQSLMPKLTYPNFCLGCPKGTYSTGSGASVCTQCSAGTYSIGTGLSACTPCPAGTYSTGIGQSLSSTCQTCSIGTYSNSGAAYCSKCTQAKYTAAPGTVECTLMSCFAGSYSSGLGLTAPSCTTCGAGTYRPIPAAMPWAPTGWLSSTDAFHYYTGDKHITDYPNCRYFQMTNAQPAYQCDNGYLYFWLSVWLGHWDVNKVGSSWYTDNGASASCPYYCQSGEYAPLELLMPKLTDMSYCLSCTICQVGLYASKTCSSEMDSACTPCPAGTYSISTSASACLSCITGTYSGTIGASSPSVCISCPTGTYSETTSLSSATLCLNCPAGTYSGTIGASSVSVCYQCAAGTYSTGIAQTITSVCQACIAGTYSTALGGTAIAVCQSCSAGSYGASTGLSVCVLCSAGKYSPGIGSSLSSTCALCGPGSYSPSSGLSVCNFCGTGTYSTAIGSTVAGTCLSCGPGSYSPSSGLSICNLCTTGSYSTTIGSSLSSTCVSCGAGSYGPVVGLSICNLCTTGTYSTAIGSSLASTCLSCGSGGYGPSTGLSVCVLCSVGKYSATIGSSLAGTCVSCGAGSYGLVVGLSICNLCTVGTYSTAIGSIAAGTCLACASGSYGPSTGLSVCALCSLGTYSTAIGSITAGTCLSCASGSYGPFTGLSVCALCITGKYSTAIGSGLSSTCLSCASGSYGPSTGLSVCTLCIAGTYSAILGANASSQCIACTVCDGGSSPSHAITTNPCLQGSVSNSVTCQCFAGYYGNNGLVCTQCPPNTNSSITNTSSLLNCVCLPGYTCAYKKKINVVVHIKNMTIIQFYANGYNTTFINAVAKAANVNASQVKIINVTASVNVSSTGARRRMLSLYTHHNHNMKSEDDMEHKAYCSDNNNSACSNRHRIFLYLLVMGAEVIDLHNVYSHVFHYHQELEFKRRAGQVLSSGYFKFSPTTFTSVTDKSSSTIDKGPFKTQINYKEFVRKNILRHHHIPPPSYFTTGMDFSLSWEPAHDLDVTVITNK